MKLGTNFGLFIKRNDLKTTLKKIADTGFETVDFSLSRTYGVEEKDEKEFYGDIKQYTKSLGLTITQAHSPFEREDLSIDYFLSDEFFDKQVSSIRRASYLEIPWLVVHPYTHSPVEGVSNAYTKEKQEEGLSVNLEFFNRLKPVFMEYKVGCAIENLAEHDFMTGTCTHCFGSSSEDLNNIIKLLDSEVFGACFDSGHANLLDGESIEHFALSLNNNLKVLHLHDNFGVLNAWGGGLDRHLPPFIGQFPWKELKNALKKINFNGAFSFECINYMPNDYFDQIFADYVYKCGRYILSDKF